MKLSRNFSDRSISRWRKRKRNDIERTKPNAWEIKSEFMGTNEIPEVSKELLTDRLSLPVKGKR